MNSGETWGSEGGSHTKRTPGEGDISRGLSIKEES